MCESDIAPASGRRRARASLARRTAEAIGAHVSEVLENEELAAKPGFLQGIDSRVKLLAILVFSVTASLLRSPWLLAAVFVLALVLAAASDVEPASFARKVWGTAGLIAVLIAIPATTELITPGRALVSLGPFTLTVPGVRGAITLVLRVVASAGIALLVVWTMRWSDLLAALTRLRVPDVIVATLAMTQKQIVSLMRTAQQIHLARESRTLTAGTAAENRDWVTGRMAFVVSKSMKTADDVYDAMLARGFGGPVRLLRGTSGGASDWGYLAAALVLSAVLLGFDRVVLS